MSTETTESQAQAFRDAMAAVCTPVSVITAMEGDRPHGTTVSAFASLSVSPPMVLVALDSGSDLLEIIRSRRAFGVNILGTDQQGEALSFARKGLDKFEGVPWTLTGGSPRLPDICGWLACEVADFVPGGDHVIVLGNVLEAESNPRDPLTYHSRVFGTHRALQETAS
ncbi:flavin reductase family protein [Rhodococcus sp. NPDC057014]|uniref:flavin reductase family protein n=1 Tax=Rhodococcus sp. NPDC057014 TaxID=3346000 RepID=UPI003643D9F1